jgi:hypothetical protein
MRFKDNKKHKIKKTWTSTIAYPPPYLLRPYQNHQQGQIIFVFLLSDVDDSIKVFVSIQLKLLLTIELVLLKFSFIRHIMSVLDEVLLSIFFMPMMILLVDLTAFFCKIVIMEFVRGSCLPS